MESFSSVPEPLIIRNSEDHYLHGGEYPVVIGGGVDGGGGSDDDSDKPSSGSALNKNALRCLLLLLPIAIPVIVYLKDIDATRRIFLAAFVLFLVVLFSCMLMALLRSRRRLSIDDEAMASNSDLARELTQRHIMAVTHRLLPRTFPASRNCQGLHGDVVSFAESRRATHHVFGGLRPSNNNVPVHYTLAPAYSRSPSPRRLRSSSPARSECGRLLGVSPTVSPFHLGLFRSSSNPNVDSCCQIRIVRDDPPSYEEALNYPLASTVAAATTEDYKSDLTMPATEGSLATVETPPPTYDRVVK